MWNATINTMASSLLASCSHCIDYRPIISLTTLLFNASKVQELYHFTGAWHIGTTSTTWNVTVNITASSFLALNNHSVDPLCSELNSSSPSITLSPGSLIIHCYHSRISNGTTNITVQSLLTLPRRNTDPSFHSTTPHLFSQPMDRHCYSSQS